MFSHTKNNKLKESDFSYLMQGDLTPLMMELIEQADDAQPNLFDIEYSDQSLPELPGEVEMVPVSTLDESPAKFTQSAPSEPAESSPPVMNAATPVEGGNSAKPGETALVGASAKVALLAAIRTGNDRFTPFVSYLLNNQHDYRGPYHAINMKKKKVESETNKRRLEYAICSGIKTIAQEVMYGLTSGYMLYQLPELPQESLPYLGGFIFEKKSRTLFYIDYVQTTEGITSRPVAIKQYQQTADFESAISTAKTRFPDGLTFLCVNQIHILTQNGESSFSKEVSRFLTYPPVVWQTILLIRLKALKPTLISSFEKETFGKILSDAERSTELPFYVTLFEKALAFYLPSDMTTLESSFWQSSSNLEVSVCQLCRLADVAEQGGMEQYSKLVSPLLEESEELNAQVSANNQTWLSQLLNDKKGRFNPVTIPLVLREEWDKRARDECGVLSHEALTDEQREVYYRNQLKPWRGVIAYNAVDSEETANTLALLALQYRNFKLYEVMERAPESGLERPNWCNLTAKAYHFFLKNGAFPHEIPEAEERQEWEAKLALLEMFLRTYLEDWSVTNAVIDKRQSARQSSKMAASIEWLFVKLDQMFKTRSQFLSRKEQALECLNLIESSRQKILSGNDYYEQLKSVVIKIDPAPLAARMFGGGSRLRHQINQSAQNLRPFSAIQRYPTQREEELAAQIVRDDKIDKKFKEFRSESKAREERHLADKMASDERIRVLEESRLADKASFEESRSADKAAAEKERGVLEERRLADKAAAEKERRVLEERLSASEAAAEARRLMDKAAFEEQRRIDREQLAKSEAMLLQVMSLLGTLGVPQKPSSEISSAHVVSESSSPRADGLGESLSDQPSVWGQSSRNTIFQSRGGSPSVSRSAEVSEGLTPMEAESLAHSKPSSQEELSACLSKTSLN